MSDAIIPLTHTKTQTQQLSHVAVQADTRYVLAKQTGDSPERIRKKEWMLQLDSSFSLS